MRGVTCVLVRTAFFLSGEITSVSLTAASGRLIKMSRQRSITGVVFLALLCLRVVYAHDEHSHKPMNHTHVLALVADEGSNYFKYPEHRSLLYGHILMLCVGWIFIMPIGEFWYHEVHPWNLLTSTSCRVKRRWLTVSFSNQTTVPCSVRPRLIPRVLIRQCNTRPVSE